jgi:hypothetical protein
MAIDPATANSRMAALCGTPSEDLSEKVKADKERELKALGSSMTYDEALAYAFENDMGWQDLLYFLRTGKRSDVVEDEES